MKWEYLGFDVDEKLSVDTFNSYGNERWELVTSLPFTAAGYPWLKVIMKRPALPPAYLVTGDDSPPIKLTELEAELYSVIAPRRKDLLPSQILDLIRQPYPPTDRPRLPPDGPATTSGRMPVEVFKPVEAVRVVPDYRQWRR